ncbi:hypothetical protein [Gimesia fumaroli]|uniref:EF hand n=1 Tax=Gimesia fumaroli TaxID=2527976 RepID=A0A518IJ43_9PLAN|nr:hypothetical protein [Gimesia fumaroli]QDV53126.1 EF hand [Gimesia fumaroli]
MFRFISLLSLSVVLVGFSADLAYAQPGGESRTRGFFSFIDKNKNGVIESSEFDQMPGRFKESLEGVGVDTSRSMTQQDFERVMPKLMERMRSQRSSSGGDDRRRSSFSRGPSSFGGSPPASFSRPGGGPGPSGGGFDPGSMRGRYGSFQPDRGGPPGSSSSSSRSKSGSSSKTEPTKPVRATVDLNKDFVPQDSDQDGQIGLYEWRKNNPTKLGEFFTMDLNGDGFLTPREIALSKAGKTQRSAASFMFALNTGQQSPSPATSAGAQPVAKQDASKSAPSQKEAVPAASKKESIPSTDPVVNQANYFFKLLDRNKDSSVSPEEWKKSRSMRRMFEKENIDLSVSMSQEQFVGHYVAIKKN